MPTLIVESRSNPSPRSRPGVAAVEFALILPLLILVALICVDFGRFAYHFIALKNAARSGAAYAIMNPYTPNDAAAWKAKVQQTARDEMFQQTGYNSSNLVVAVSITHEGNGLHRVRVDATYPTQTLITWPGIPSTINLQRVIEMRSIR